jgi:GNAT superfamily N-acetyltransferase
MIAIREARDADTAGIIDIYLATYGEEYAYPQYYDEYEIKKLVYSDETLMFVAEDSESGRVVGTASVILEVGAYTDLVGEFGRLAVHPEFRRRGIGTELLNRRIETVRDRVHVGVIEGRVTHPFTQAIAQQQGFAPVGFLPRKFVFGSRRESMGFLVRLFGRALELRRNNPRIVPEVYPLACTAMENCGLEADVIVDDESGAYPFVFGPLRLQYGYFKLITHHSKYLVAREGGHIVGAIGFTLEHIDRVVRVFELISLRDDAIRLLLLELERRCRDDWNIAYMEIDVSAHAPRMQRTVLQLGWVPVAYVPALAFHDVERLDLVKFARLLIPVDVGPLMLIPPTSDMAKLVLAAFKRREVMPRLGELVDRAGLFQGLEEEQLERLAAAFRYVTFDAGTGIFSQGDRCEEMYLLLTGAVEIRIQGSSAPIGTVEAGECLGEVAVLMGGDHSATAVAVDEVEAGVLTRQDLESLVRLRPGIGVVLYRNVARGLGGKLRRADMKNFDRTDLA